MARKDLNALEKRVRQMYKTIKNIPSNGLGNHNTIKVKEAIEGEKGLKKIK